MATTTNYSWTTPDDTALVKDGAAAIRSLGTSIDTTTKNLNPETTLGDIAYRSSTANTNTRLALGTAGQVLTVNSGATAPEWAAPVTGGMTLLSTTTLSGASTTVSSISTSYIDLVVQIIGVTASTANGYIAISPAATDNISYQAQLNSANTTVDRQAANYILTGLNLQHDRTNANNFSSLRINNYSTAEYKSFADQSFYVTSTAVIRGTTGGGGINTASAMTSIKFTYTGGNWAGGTVRIYGVK
jgi:hypothetical protein